MSGFRRGDVPYYTRVFFFFQAEDGIRDKLVTGVQTCALPISEVPPQADEPKAPPRAREPATARRARDAVATPKAGAPVQTASVNETEAAPKAKEVASPLRPREPESVATIPAPTREATLNIVALPWAEVFVDGTRQGVSPPLRAIPLRPGRHRVELRNGSFPAHIETVELKPGTEVSITHRFPRSRSYGRLSLSQ